MVQSYFLFVRLHDTCRNYSLQSNLKTVGLSDTRGPFLFMIKLTTMNYRFIIIRFSRVSFIDVILFSNSLLQRFLAGICTFGLIFKKMEGRLIHTHFTKKDQMAVLDKLGGINKCSPNLTRTNNGKGERVNHSDELIGERGVVKSYIQ